MRTARLGNDGALSAPSHRSAARAMAAGGARERARRRLVTVVFVIYMLLIFEGSIRKWLLPQLSVYVFFVRDPFVLYAYFLAFKYGLWPRRSPLLMCVLLLSVIGMFTGGIALVASGAANQGLLLAAYGWRNYFLYAPLAFLIGAQLATEDLARFARWTLLLCAPVGLLVAAQFFAPVDSAINVGTATDEALQFIGLTTTAEHTRPMGTFSSGAGQNQFVTSAFAILLALLITPSRQVRVRPWILIAAAAGLATCLAFGGSRGAVLQCGLIGVVAMVVGLASRSGAVKVRAILVPLLLGLAFAVAYPVLFPAGFEAFTQRWDAAAAVETRGGGISGRALLDFVDFTRLLGDAPLLGYGPGMGGNAALTLGINRDVYAETDWARNIVDFGPVLGVCYIALRIVVTAWLGLLVLRAARRGAGAWPVLLFAYCGYVLLIGQITGQGAVNGYAWLFAGFTIAAAAARTAPPRPTSARTTARSSPWRRPA